MTEKELVARIVALAEDAAAARHLEAAAVLFHLAGAVTAGPEWLRRAFDATSVLSAAFVQFVDGTGETVQ